MSSIMKGLVDETEAKKGADGKRCWKGKRYAGTENGKDKCVPVKNESAYEADLDDNEPRIVSGVYGAKSKEFRKKFANQQAQDRFFDHPDREGNFEIHYVQKANMAEGVIIGHDKDDPQVAVLGGAGSYKLSNLKKKALGEAKQLAADIANGEYKNSAYNVKQLANTLNTIVAAEDEMEKSYFGENAWNQLGQRRPGKNLPAPARGSVPKHGRHFEEGDIVIPMSGLLAGEPHRVVHSQRTSIRIVPLGRNSYPGDIIGPRTKHEWVVPASEEQVAKAREDAKAFADKVKNFSEDFTGQFSAERTAETNPYGGMKDRQYRGALGEDYKTRPITPALRAAQKNMAGLASGEVQRRERERKAAEKAQRQASKDLDRMLNRKPAKKSKQDLETLWAKIENVIANSFPDGEPYDALWPYMQKNGFTQDDVERASKMHGYNDLWDYWNTLTQDIENDAYYDWHATGGKNVRTRGTFVETPTDNPTGASGEGGWRKYRPKVSEDLSQADVDSIERFADKLYKKLGIDITFTKHFMDRVNDERNGKPISGAELVRLFKKEYERWGKDVAQMGPDMEGTFKDLTTDINLPFVLRWDRDEEELDLIAKTVMRKKNFKTHNQEFPVESAIMKGLKR